MRNLDRHLVLAAYGAVAFGLAACCPPSATQQPTLPSGPAQPTPIDVRVDGDDGAPALVFPDEPFRATQPAATEPRPFQLPEVASFTLDNGLLVYLVERHDLPVVYLQLSFDGGSMNDPKGKEGMAEICMNMLTEGTEELEKIAYKEALADIASHVTSYASNETQSVSMYTLGKHFDATLALFADTLRRPGMRQGDFDRMIKRRLEALKQEKGAGDSVAMRLFNHILFGPRHPFGRLVTEKSLSSFKLADCKRYQKAYLAPKGARLFAFGDLDRERIRQAFAGPLADWKGKPRRSAKLPAPRSRQGRVFFVDIPGSANTTIWFTDFGPRRDAEDYVANELMTAVLGSGFGSRINMNLREDKGSTYGAFGGFFYLRDYGVFYAGSSVDGRSTWQSVQEIYKEIRDLHGPGNGPAPRPATAAELERDRNGAILSLPADFATGRQVLGKFRELVHYGLPLDYYDTYVAKLTAATLEDVNASAKKHLRPDDALILIAGDAKVPLIKREGDKDVDLLDQDGKPITALDGLVQLVKSGALGKGTLVVLDADGNVLKTFD